MNVKSKKRKRHKGKTVRKKEEDRKHTNNWTHAHGEKDTHQEAKKDHKHTTNERNRRRKENKRKIVL